MATVTRLASDGLSSASTTITSAATITAVVGDWLLVAIAANNRAADGSSHWADTISDSDGINTYITRANVNYNPAGTNTGATVILVTAAVTDALTNATISMTWDTAAFGAGAYQIFRIRPGAGEGPITFVTADTSGSTGSATNHSAATVSVALGNMIFGAAAIETNISITGDSDTSNGSWSALSTDFYPNATDTLGMTSAVQWKTVTGTGNQSWTCSTTSAKDSARSYLVLHLASAAYSLSAGGGAYNYNGTAATMRKSMAPMVAGAGSYAMTGTAATPVHGAVIPALAGSYTLSGTDAATTHAWKATADVGSYTLTGTAATPFKTAVAGKTITAELGTYALGGTDANLLHAYLPSAAIGSYALTGTTTPTLHGWRVAAGTDTGLPLLDESGNPLLDELGNPILNEGGVIGGTYGLTGSIVGLNRSAGNKTMIGEAGAYTLTGTDATLTIVTLVNKTLAADAGTYSLTGTTANTLEGFKVAALAGSYALAGTDAALSKSTAKSIAAESGSYALTGTDTTLTLGAAPAVPLAPSPLHIGEWPIDKKKRRRREDAAAAEQRARKRFRDALGRLLEGLPPEFDEPEALDEALDSAVQASNLLYAMSAPIREINAVNELIDHIKQLRIAQPIAQLHLAQAYNQAHRHLMAKAQEDTVMALLLGE